MDSSTNYLIDLTDLTEKQQELVDLVWSEDFPKKVLWDGSMRSGKTLGTTVAHVTKILIDQTLQRNGWTFPDIIAGASKQSVVDNVRAYYQDLAEQWGMKFHIKGGAAQTTMYVGNKEVLIIGGGNKGTVDRLRGKTIMNSVVDEANAVDESFLDVLADRLTFKDSMLFMTTNASTSPYHWFYKRHVADAENSGTHRISSNYFENQHISDARREQRLSELDPNSLHYKRFIENLWIAADGLVFPIMPEHIFRGETRDDRSNFVSVDVGAAGVTAGLYFVRNEYSSWVVGDEYYYDATHRPARTDDEHIDAMQKQFGSIRFFVVDPAAAHFKNSIYRRGIKVRNARNDIDDGIRKSRDALFSGKIKIAEKCREFLGEAAIYAYDSETDKPVKAHDHACDAFRYGCMQLFGSKGFKWA